MTTMEDMLRYLIDKGGSDLHLLAGLPPAIRLHGEMTSVEGAEAMTPDSVKQLVYSILTGDQIDLYEKESATRYELDFAYGIPKLGRFRCNVYRQRGTVACVIRALATDIPELASLGLPASVAKMTEYKKGLVLVTGPTGSGKSTTLASMIHLINCSRREHIITIEDPIEYVHNSRMSFVSQREVGLSGDTMSFSNALKYALRQDPDVILVGELRDFETIGIAITSAETGHLVFGTLHTSSAAQTVGRIIDVFPTDQQPQVITQLSSGLVGVLSQILLPTADGTGRVAAAEIMLCNSAIKNQIRTGSVDGIYQSIQTGSKEGMYTMDQSITILVKEGKVDYETVCPHIRDEVTHRQLQQFKKPPGAATEAMGSLVDQADAPQQSVAPAPEPQAPPTSSAESDPASGGRGATMQEIPPWEQ